MLTPDKVALRKGEGVEGKSGQSEELISVPIEIVPDKWYSIALICRDNEFLVIIDQEQIISYEDTQEPNLYGAFALGALPDSRVVFDDIIVNTLITD